MQQKQKSKPSLLHRWLIPSAHNKRFPHLIRPHGIVLTLVLVFAVQFGQTLITPEKTMLLASQDAVNQSELINQLNQSRIENKVDSLQIDESLAKAAQLKASDMIQQQYWAHNSPDGTTPWHWFDAANYSYQYAGENLAKNFYSEAGVVNAWAASASHRENMLNADFKDIGVAVKSGLVNGEQTTFIVALFGTRKSTGVLGQQTTVATTLGGVAHLAQIKTLLTPLNLLSAAILLVTLFVALLTHWHYLKLPKNIRKTWYKHPALYTSGLILLFIGYVTYIFSSGSI